MADQELHLSQLLSTIQTKLTKAKNAHGLEEQHDDIKKDLKLAAVTHHQLLLALRNFEVISSNRDEFARLTKAARDHDTKIKQYKQTVIDMLDPQDDSSSKQPRQFLTYEITNGKKILVYFANKWKVEKLKQESGLNEKVEKRKQSETTVDAVFESIYSESRFYDLVKPEKTFFFPREKVFLDPRMKSLPTEGELLEKMRGGPER